jgi:hypothetical protein
LSNTGNVLYQANEKIVFEDGVTHAIDQAKFLNDSTIFSHHSHLLNIILKGRANALAIEDTDVSTSLCHAIQDGISNNISL